MKQLKTILKVVVLAAVLGFLMSVLKHNGYWGTLMQGFRKIPFYVYPFLIIFYLFLNILIHELGHLFSFVFQGIKIRALYVLIFVLKKQKNNKWKLEIHWKNIKLFGGLVVPNLPNIDTDEEFVKNREKFTKALIAGPITSIAFLVVTILAFIVCWFFTKQYLLIGMLAVLTIVTILMTLLIIASSKLNTNELYGDFVAHKKFQEDETFAMVQLVQYTGFSLIANEKGDDYFYERITKYYENKFPGYGIFDLVLMSHFMNLCLQREDAHSLVIEDIILKYNIHTLARSEHGLELGYLIAAYYYKNQNAAKAYETINLILLNKNRKISTDKQEILEKQYKHLLNLEDNTDYFETHKQVLLEDYHLLAPIIDLEEIYEQLVVKLPFVEYFSNVEYRDDEEKIVEN